MEWVLTHTWACFSARRLGQEHVSLALLQVFERSLGASIIAHVVQWQSAIYHIGRFSFY
jgi:hypothetical protein